MHMIFTCLARLEDATYQLYEALFDKTEQKQIRLLLGKIMLETRNHKEILEQLSRDYERTLETTTTCEEEMGELYAKAMESTRSMKQDVQAGMPLLEALRILVQHEDAVGEEYITQVHARIKALGESDRVVKRLLEDIAAEEKTHSEDLRLAIEIASQS